MGLTMLKYSCTDTSSPGGPCLETMLQNARILDKLAPDLDHPMHTEKMSIDSHSVKDMSGMFELLSITLSTQKSSVLTLYLTLCLST